MKTEKIRTSTEGFKIHEVQGVLDLTETSRTSKLTP